LDKIIHDEVVLAGWTMDALVYHGRWIVIAHDLPLPQVPFPNFKIEVSGKWYVADAYGRLLREATAAELELLDFQSSRAPIVFQDAIEALHGFREWQADYDG